MTLELRTPRPATGVSRALRARGVPGSVPESVPEKGGCPTECPTGCPKSVPRVSPECLGHLFVTPGRLSGHFLDTPEPGARRAPETPRRTLRRTPPVFGDTLGDTPRDTSGPKGPRDSCSWPGSSQLKSGLWCWPQSDKNVTQK